MSYCAVSLLSVLHPLLKETKQNLFSQSSEILWVHLSLSRRTWQWNTFQLVSNIRKQYYCTLYHTCLLTRHPKRLVGFNKVVGNHETSSCSAILKCICFVNNNVASSAFIIYSSLSEHNSTVLNLGQEWCLQRGLKINPKKTIIVPFTNRRNLAGLNSSRKKNEIIQFDINVKYLLGVILNNDPKIIPFVRTLKIHLL